MLKNKTQIKKVKAEFQPCNEELEHTRIFKDQVYFYTEQKSLKMKKVGSFEERMRSCDQEQMFQQMID